MFNYNSLFNYLQDDKFLNWSATLQNQLSSAFNNDRHSDLPRWLETLRSLPVAKPTQVDFAPTITIGDAENTTPAKIAQIESQLRGLMPWRKGPYTLFGIHIDTEWRSDWKWDRVKDHITPLTGRTVLDVGCGNGYHGWRMLGAGAELVIGIDPYMLSVMQYQAIRHFIGDEPMYVLPLGIEDMPTDMPAFDTVFSMGVLYHRRSPMDHLYELKGLLRPAGELVLETLVIDGGPGQVLVPEGRYAKMRNVWFIPSPVTLESWLKRCGYTNVRCVDVTKTTTGEQHSTDWMQWESLADFLDPDNPNLTIEGHPAPVRAVFVAERA